MKTYHIGRQLYTNVFLVQPSSAAAERVFSLLKKAFGEQQQSSLHDLVAATLMVQYNKRGLQ